MNAAKAQPATERLADFYERLRPVEPIIRIVLSDAPVSCVLTFRGAPEKSVLLDYGKRPARIAVDEPAPARTAVSIRGDIMHDVMSRKLAPGTALARRELLLRGSAADLAKFIQLLEFGPILYCEHLADIGYPGYARTNGSPKTSEDNMADKIFEGNPIPVIRMNPFERVASRIIGGLAWFMGYATGMIRYRIIKKLSLFDVLTSMSNGLEAARPKNEITE
jgi:hypothetical protein